MIFVFSSETLKCSFGYRYISRHGFTPERTHLQMSLTKLCRVNEDLKLRLFFWTSVRNPPDHPSNRSADCVMCKRN